METKELKKALETLFSALPAQPISEEPNGGMERIDLTQEPDGRRWRELATAALERAGAFEIHCWNGEEAQLALALRYGTEQETGWSYGHVVAGTVTPAFREMLLGQPKPEDEGTQRKMTPFFNVFVDSLFSSSHYGTEVYIKKN